MRNLGMPLGWMAVWLSLSIGAMSADADPSTGWWVYEWHYNSSRYTDGWIEEWEELPDFLWLRVGQENDAGESLFWNHDGRSAAEEFDFYDLEAELIFGWDDEGDGLHFGFRMIDDVHARDPDRSGSGVCGGNDSIWITIDAGDGIPQRFEFSWPPAGAAQAWLRMPSHPSVTWHDDRPYGCCASSYEIQSLNGQGVALFAEGYIRHFKHPGADRPAFEDRVRITDCDAIKMGVAICDSDPGQDEDTLWRFKSGGSFADPDISPWGLEDFWFNGLCSSYAMPTVIGNMPPWGQIKSEFPAPGNFSP